MRAAHIVIQLALKAGANVYVVTREKQHQEFALAMGAKWTGSDASLVPERLDSIILFAPAGDLVPKALAILEKGGTLAIGGIHLSPIPPLDYEQHLFYEKELRSVTANTRRDGIELFEAATLHSVEPQVTSFPLEKANQALQDLKADQIRGTGILLCS